MQHPRELLSALFYRAVAQADPRQAIARHLPKRSKGRSLVIGVGKAAAVMVATVEEAWSEDRLEGIALTRYGHQVPTRHIEVIEAGHPLSDDNGMRGAQKICGLISGLSPTDQVLVCLSGGGSALMALPGGQLTLNDWNEVNHALLLSGCSIHELNTVRKHCSALNGGRLARLAQPAQVIGLVISDVPGDDIAMVASGPVSGEGSSAAEALAILQRYAIPLSGRVQRHLQQAIDPPVRPEEMLNFNVHTQLIGSARQSLEAAAEYANRLGLNAHVLSDALQGESHVVGRELAECVNRIVRQEHAIKAPCVLLSGGETSVTIPKGFSSGKGGRNAECLMSALLHYDRLKPRDRQSMEVHWLFADTDGIDGTEDNAGAFGDDSSLKRLQSVRDSAQRALHQHDTYTAFKAIGDLWVTGPTHTNVNDFRAILITPKM